MHEGDGVAHIGADELAVLQQLLVQRLTVDRGLVIEVLKDDVLHLDRSKQAGAQPFLVVKIRHLHADLGVLVGIEGGDAGLGGTEGLAAQALLLVGVLKCVIGHQDLRPFGDDEVRGGNALIGDALQLIDQLHNIQRHTVADDVGDVGIENAGRQNVQREAAIVVDDGVTRVCTALETDDNVGMFRHHVSDFTLAFVAPVGANDRFYHSVSSWRGVLQFCPIPHFIYVSLPIIIHIAYGFKAKMKIAVYCRALIC